MPKLLKMTGFVEDACQILPGDFNGEEVPESVLVPLNYWLNHRDRLRQSSTVGVWLESEDEPGALAADIPGLARIGINFPTFMDGRGFSTARLLRERYGFSGELRAIGHFIPDQLFYLRRCGFDSFQLEDDLNLEKLQVFLNAFSNSYQTGIDQPLPLFRRRIS